MTPRDAKLQGSSGLVLVSSRAVSTPVSVVCYLHRLVEGMYVNSNTLCTSLANLKRYFDNNFSICMKLCNFL